MQDITTGEGVPTLYRQLAAMNTFIRQHADPHTPTLLLGDLNVPAEEPPHYARLLESLQQPVDLWTVAGHAPASGFTYVTDNNFNEDNDDRPSKDQRLDYVLMIAGFQFIPILDRIEVVRFTRGDRAISDHFGVLATFESVVEVSS